jgi:hypothetical protein
MERRIHSEVIDSGARVVVVDNITFLRHDNEKARNAASAT